MAWHDLRDPNDPELDRLAARYKLHPLHVEDCRHRNQNAKLEDSPNYLFVVLKPLDVLEDGSLEFGDIDVFLGGDFLVTVEESNCSTMRKLLDRVKAHAEGQRPDQLFYQIMDGVVDSYVP